MKDFVGDYSQKYVEQYAEQSFETVLVRVRSRHVISILERYHSRLVAEIGCGLEPLFVSWDNFDELIVVEPSSEFVKVAQQRAAKDSRITIVQGFLEEVASQFKERDLDMVVVSSLLHEVEDPRRLLAAVRSLCGPRTVAHFNVPNVRSFHRLLALEMGLIEDLFERSAIEERFHRHTRFDRQSFETMVQQAGFEVLEFGTWLIKPFTHEQMQSLLASGAIDGRVIDGLDRMTKYLPEMGCEMFVNARPV